MAFHFWNATRWTRGKIGKARGNLFLALIEFSSVMEQWWRVFIERSYLTRFQFKNYAYASSSVDYYYYYYCSSRLGSEKFDLASWYFQLSWCFAIARMKVDGNNRTRNESRVSKACGKVIGKRLYFPRKFFLHSRRFFFSFATNTIVMQ